MAKLFNRAKMTTSTTGSGTVTLSSAANGFQSFADAGVSDGDVIQYVIEEGSAWEIGTGTYSASGTSLTRTPSESSNSGSAISLGGTAKVSITTVAADLNRLQNAGSDIVTVSAAGAAVTGNITVTGTVDGVDIATRDGVLTSTTTTANAALPKAGGTMTGAITFAAGQTFDGRDVSADGSKLDGIETGATADQTKADIDALNIDADTVDSLHASSFLRSDANDTMNGHLNLGAYTINDVEDIYLRDKMFHSGDTDTYLGFGTNSISFVAGGISASYNANGIFLDDGSLREDYDALSGTTPTCNVNNGGAFSLSMSGNTTFTFTSPTSGFSTGFVLQLTGNGGTVTWPSSVDWAGGTAPDAPASGETDLLVFWTRDGGTTWYGMLAIDAAA